MTRDKISILKDLKVQWGIIKSGASDADKDIAKAKINDLQEELKVIEPETKITDWDKPAPKKDDPKGNTANVVWPSCESNPTEIEQFERVQSTAVAIAKKQHPDLNPTTDLFGQITNAITAHLINLRG